MRKTDTELLERTVALRNAHYSATRGHGAGLAWANVWHRILHWRRLKEQAELLYAHKELCGLVKESEATG